LKEYEKNSIFYLSDWLNNLSFLMTQLKILCLFMAFGLMHSVHGQEVKAQMSSYQALDEMEELEILGSHRDTSVISLGAYKKAKLMVFDSSMQLVAEQKMNFGSRKIPVKAFLINDSIHFYYFSKKGSLAKLHCIRYDLQLHPTDTIDLFEEAFNFSFDPYHCFSLPQRDLFTLFKISNKTHLKVLNFKKSSRSLVDSFFIPLQKFKNKEFELDAQISRDGEVFISFMKNDEGFNENHVEWEIYALDKGNSHKINIHFTDKLITSWIMEMDELNDQLIIAGYYGERSDVAARGIFTIRVDQKDYSWTSHFESFTEEEVFEMTGKRKRREKRRYVSYLEAKSLICRSDGGIILFGEYVYKRTQGQNLSMTGISLKPFMEFYFENVMIHSLNKKGDKEWFEVIYKKQYSQDDDARYSSFFLLKGKQQLSILTNDEIKSKNTMSKYDLEVDGTLSRSHFLLENLRWPNVAFQHAKQLDTDRFLILEFSRKREFRLLDVQL